MLHKTILRLLICSGLFAPLCTLEAQEKPTTIQWEYKVYKENYRDTTETVEKKLNELGSEGWELVGSLSNNPNVHYLKRVKRDAVAKAPEPIASKPKTVESKSLNNDAIPINPEDIPSRQDGFSRNREDKKIVEQDLVAKYDGKKLSFKCIISNVIEDEKAKVYGFVGYQRYTRERGGELEPLIMSTRDVTFFLAGSSKELRQAFLQARNARSEIEVLIEGIGSVKIPVNGKIDGKFSSSGPALGPIITLTDSIVKEKTVSGGFMPPNNDISSVGGKKKSK